MIHSYCIIALFLILPITYYLKKGYFFDIRDQSSTVLKYVAIALFSALLLYGIFTNIPLITVICSRNNYYSWAFILIVLQLTICNLFIFLIQAAYILPEILKTKSNSNGKLFFTFYIRIINLLFISS